MQGKGKEKCVWFENGNRKYTGRCDWPASSLGHATGFTGNILFLVLKWIRKITRVGVYRERITYCPPASYGEYFSLSSCHPRTPSPRSREIRNHETQDFGTYLPLVSVRPIFCFVFISASRVGKGIHYSNAHDSVAPSVVRFLFCQKGGVFAADVFQIRIHIWISIGGYGEGLSAFS